MDFKKNNIPGTDKKVICFGNMYMSDDAIGLKVLEWLKGKIKGVELIDGGTSAADLIIYAEIAKKIIIIDAVDAGQDIGEIVKFGTEEISRFEDNLKSFSLHDFNLSQALGIINSLNMDIKIVVIGIKPKKVCFGEGLSPEIEEKIPEIADMVIREIYD